MPGTRLLCFVTLSALIPAVVLADLGWIDPPDTEKQISSHGYPVEVHHAVTEDGYVLKLFRIPRGKTNTVASKPLLLVHGLLCSSDCWTLSGPDNGLAYILADRGYDVWIANNRGNSYSATHMTISTDDPKLWDFGIHEMGVYDLPAMIDYIIEKTNEPQISFTAHSQGTTLFFIMASMRPEYQDKINVATLLAPVAYLDNTRGLVNTLTALSSVLLWYARTVGLVNFGHNNLITRATGQLLCTDRPLIGNVCKDVLFDIAGSDNALTNRSLYGQITSYAPAGASTKQMEHFIQLMKNGRQFNQYDYGPVENMLRYGTLSPPKYPLENIKTPMFLYYSDNDSISTTDAVHRLVKSLPNVQRYYLVPYPTFNHLDFMWAINATSLVFNPAINDMVIFR